MYNNIETNNSDFYKKEVAMLKTDFFKNVYFSNDFGTGADEPNEGNLGAEDIYGFDENDND